MIKFFFYIIFALLVIAYNYPLNKKRPLIQAQEEDDTISVNKLER